MQSVEGRVAVVTGGAAGMGLGMVRAFAGAGMRVVAADVRADALDAAVAELRAAGHDVIGVPTDVSQLADVEALAAATMDAFGAVHVLCNNAGVGMFAPISKTSIDDWEWILGIDLWGPIYGIKVFLPLIEQQDEGHINSTSSVAGLVAGGAAGPYNVAKHGVVALMATLERELRAAKSPVRTSVLCPGRGEHRHRPQQHREPPGPARPDVRRARPRAPSSATRWPQALAGGMEPDEVGHLVLDAILARPVLDLHRPAAAQPPAAAGRRDGRRPLAQPPPPRLSPADVRRSDSLDSHRHRGGATPHEVRRLLRAPAAPPVDGRERAHAAQERARRDRARRPPGLRLRLGGRAPLPRGVQPQLGARGLPRRGEPAHEQHPPRPRHRAADDEPPGTGRRARSPRSTCSATAGSSSAWARAARRPSCTRSTGRFRDKRSVWEDAVQVPDPDVQRRALGVPRAVVRLPDAQRRAEAVPAAASAAVGGVQPAGDDRDGRPPRASARSGFQFVSGDAARAWVNHYYRTFTQELEPAHRLPAEPEHRARQRVHVRADRRGGAGQGRGLDVLPVRPALLRQGWAPRCSSGRHPAGCGRSTWPGGSRRRGRRPAATRR